MTLTDKRALRRAVREELAKLSHEDKRLFSADIFDHIESLPQVKEASVVALFASLDDEPQTEVIIERLSHHKRVVLPRIEGDEMEFYDLASGALAEGAFGIMEPQSGELVEPRKIDVMVVPGVAFTPLGDRLGRGKGFYDRYLSREGFRAYCVGVCYPHQMVDELPVEPHDRRMDEVVSGNE